jgi:hypothetical protein
VECLSELTDCEQKVSAYYAFITTVGLSLVPDAPGARSVRPSSASVIIASNNPVTRPAQVTLTLRQLAGTKSKAVISGEWQAV